MLAGFAVAALAGAGFLAIESRRRSPMLPLGLFDSPTFSAATAIGLLVNVVFYGLIFVLSLYFQRPRATRRSRPGSPSCRRTAAVMAGNLLAGGPRGASAPPR